MDIGLLTVGLRDISLEEKIHWAGKWGFAGIEAACWPRINSRDYAASDIDVEKISSEYRNGLKKILEQENVRITSLAYYDNNLHPDMQTRKAINEHVYKCIDAAEKLNIPSVGTFIGKNPEVSVEENFRQFQEIFSPMAEYAEYRNVKLIIENCQMEGWQTPGIPGTISYSPELWDEMFKLVPNKNFGLNFDPSHLLIMGIDYIPLIYTYKDRIFHVHAKDAYLDRNKYQYYGCFNRQIGRRLENGYWEYRVPGRGQVDFKGVIQALKLIGYDGILSIEHEDRLYEGSLKLAQEGFLHAKTYLEDLLKEDCF